ncbi:hypothetical protein ACFVTY_16655 [Streptomyces sp. NPDC058067]|uniref:hypothetical protein n=1 Tax=Streptomyces sp. NPDC058067 TaxID=3346324 RepID=UPI0036E34A05
MRIRHVPGDRRPRASATRTAGALVAAATALTMLGAAAPASAATPAPATTISSPARPAARETHGDSHALLYGGFAAALCGLGALAMAAARSRRG